MGGRERACPRWLPPRSVVARAPLLPPTTPARRHYAELGGLTTELVRDNATRAGVHASLVEALKETNKIIQLGAALRVGEPRARVVAACRAAMAGGREANPLLMMAALQSGGAA